MTDRNTALECLRQINPAVCDYNEWLAAGMALKDAGGQAGRGSSMVKTDIAKRIRQILDECEISYLEQHHEYSRAHTFRLPDRADLAHQQFTQLADELDRDAVCEALEVKRV